MDGDTTKYFSMISDLLRAPECTKNAPEKKRK